MRRLLEAIQKPSRSLLGLMSGMSADGIDLAWVRVAGTPPDLEVRLLGSASGGYSARTREILARQPRLSALDVAQLDVLVAEDFARCVNDFLAARGLRPDEIDAIGSHGQTLVHVPRGGAEVPCSLQVGSGSVLAERTGIPAVTNFRLRDIAVGGEGAPLIPLVDWLLYRTSGRTVALNNLGSISNVTVVTERLEDVFAFDTGPANMPIDFFARRVPDNALGVDQGGALSARGRVQEDLLDELLALPFLERPPPRSAGYEDFGPTVLERLAKRHPDHDPLDLVRTAVEFSAASIGQAYERFVRPRHPELSRVIFTGGGVYNATLMARIRERLPDLEITTLDREQRELNDAKEALGFALLANETLSGRCGNVPSATGASRPVILGEIAP